MNIKKSDTVGSIVVHDVRAASVLSDYGVNFYSEGGRTLEDACIEENVSMTSVIEDLSSLTNSGEDVPDLSGMNMIELPAYILKNHHRFAERKIVFIRSTMERVIRLHRDEKRIALIKKHFEDLSVYLTVHMKHEEFMIFPYIVRMYKGKRMNLSMHASIDEPISSMRDDHRYEAAKLKALARLTGNFTVPVYGDHALRVTYQAMKELSEDLKVHMHVENNILFPRAVEFAYSVSRSTGQALNFVYKGN